MKSPWRDPLFVEADRLFREIVMNGQAAFAKLLADAERDPKKRRRRVDEPWPYLLVRSRVGDNGTRPIAVSRPWRSPDVWLLGNQPAETAPALPPPLPTLPGVPAWPNVPYFATEGADHTVYAHVWNLGRAPVGQALVEFFSVLPPSTTAALDAGHATLIGSTRVDLPPRSAASCHCLVKCPTTWQPILLPASFRPRTSAVAPVTVTLVARVSSFNDPYVGGSSWNPAQDRHIAAHDVLVQRQS
jgi:hypothetical protein